jgi:protein TonB
MNQVVMNAEQCLYKQQVPIANIMAFSLEIVVYKLFIPKRKTMKRISSNIQAMMAGIALLVFFVACTNNNQSTKSSAYDSSNVATSNDTSMNHMQQPTDTAAANVATEKPASKEASANKAMASKKKGKAMVGTMAETKRAQKTAYKPDANGIYDAAEVTPAYPGGHSALSDYIANHIDYPQMAIDDNKEGTVNVQFVVDENGKVQNAKVVGSKLGDGLDEEAERVISTMPKWNAGMVKGKPVKARVTLPITYQIQQ